MDQPTFADLEYQPGIPGKEAQDPPRTVSGADGRSDSLGKPVGPHPSLLPQGRQGPTSLPAAGHAPDPLRPALLQFERPWDGGPALRVRSGQEVRGPEELSGPLPDETTILNFRCLLERRSLGQRLLQEINAHLESRGLKLREGTIVDATIIEAPSSTKNRSGERDPEMHQTKCIRPGRGASGTLG